MFIQTLIYVLMALQICICWAIHPVFRGSAEEGSLTTSLNHSHSMRVSWYSFIGHSLTFLSDMRPYLLHGLDCE